MPVDLRDPVILLDRIDGAEGELRSWFLLLLTWRAMGFALDEDTMSSFGAHGRRLEELREKISKMRKRDRASDRLFQEVLDAMESHHKIEGAFWELASRFSEEHGLKRGGWGLPPEWR
jgi:hypothetical protein